VGFGGHFGQHMPIAAAFIVAAPLPSSSPPLIVAFI
jgi:hypothetical protein